MNEVTQIRHDEPQLPADPMVSMIERVVMNPDADLDKLERMLAMKERMDMQNARVSFARALSDARAEIPPIMKDATVDFTSGKGRTHYKHETLAGIAKVIDPILSRYGLSYRFRTEQGQGGVKVTCIIAHSEGHSEETSLSGAPDGSGSKNSFQAVGSAVTYLQRYTLKAALGLSAEVDDDGQAAAPRDVGENKPRQEQQVSPAQRAADQMISAIRKNGADTVQASPQFQQDFPRLKKDAPELAARVEAEIEKWNESNKPAPSSLIGDDEIPY
ncbi:ERF family protein [Phaeobacter sp. PT47_59]|uniref:ERF family protein n=1 Tax=Phaeobacter sp. PT47_59 TaxID=3029979 RepID=UPI002380233A|nr:ERF family protein [Phaeobacter sp. PT47_59]MDE4176332.1 ERF family protein [Phaeobacter sp. PT47_59]